MASVRNEKLDIIRGIAAFLVISGHTMQVYDGYTDNPLYNFITSIQMPLFMMVSGYAIGYSAVIDGTTITSNAVSFKHMAAYCNVPTKGTLYVIGSCCGWPEPSATNKEGLIEGGWYITETEIGSNVFKGVVGKEEIPAGDLTFRFYSKLTGWGSDDDPEGSIGWQAKDEAGDYSIASGTYSGSCTPGKGSWHFADFPGGKLDLTVDLNNNKVTFVVQ